jgi:hypothetical protein
VFTLGAWTNKQRRAFSPAQGASLQLQHAPEAIHFSKFVPRRSSGGTQLHALDGLKLEETLLLSTRTSFLRVERRELHLHKSQSPLLETRAYTLLSSIFIQTGRRRCDNHVEIRAGLFWWKSLSLWHTMHAQFKKVKQKAHCAAAMPHGVDDNNIITSRKGINETKRASFWSLAAALIIIALHNQWEYFMRAVCGRRFISLQWCVKSIIVRLFV